MGQLSIIKFCFDKEWIRLDQALGSKSAYQSQAFLSVTDLADHLEKERSALVICSLTTKNDLIQIASLIKWHKKLSNNFVLKIAVINFSRNREFDKSIAKLGILDIIEVNTNVRALRYKIEFLMKSINAQLKKIDGKETTDKLSKNKDAAVLQKKKLEDGLKVNWTEPLDSPEDIWLITHENDCKKILNKWMIKLMGPSPYAATWVEHANLRGVWKFELKAEIKSMILDGPGFWYFKGDQKPEFVWKENRWLISGWEFELYYEDKQQRVSRLDLKAKLLNVAKNSMYAETKEDIIVKSFDKEMLFKKDKDVVEKNTLEKDGFNADRLEGHGKTENIENKALSGEGSKSSIDDKKLSLDLKPGDQNISDGKLSQKGEVSKDSSPLKGKVGESEKTSTNQDGVASEKLKDADLLSQDVGNQEVEAFYKGKSESEEAKKAAEKKNSESTKNLNTGEQNDKKALTENVKKDDPLEQKKKTEKINGQYTGEAKEQKNDESLDKKSRPTDKLHEGDLLAQEKQTEKLKSHYSAHNTYDESAPPKDKKNGENSSQNKEQKNLSHSTSDVNEGSQLDLDKKTEKIKTHYNSHNPQENANEKESKEKADLKKQNDDKKNQDKEIEPLSSKGPKNLQGAIKEEKVASNEKLDLKHKTENISTHYKSGDKAANAQNKKSEASPNEIKKDDVLAKAKNNKNIIESALEEKSSETTRPNLEKKKKSAHEEQDDFDNIKETTTTSESKTKKIEVNDEDFLDDLTGSQSGNDGHDYTGKENNSGKNENLQKGNSLEGKDTEDLLDVSPSRVKQEHESKKLNEKKKEVTENDVVDNLKKTEHKTENADVIDLLQKKKNNTERPKNSAEEDLYKNDKKKNLSPSTEKPEDVGSIKNKNSHEDILDKDDVEKKKKALLSEELLANEKKKEKDIKGRPQEQETTRSSSKIKNEVPPPEGNSSLEKMPSSALSVDEKVPSLQARDASGSSEINGMPQLKASKGPEAVSRNEGSDLKQNVLNAKGQSGISQLIDQLYQRKSHSKDKAS